MQLWAGEERPIGAGKIRMDDWIRKIISFRRQEEAGRHSLLAGPERATGALIGQRRWVNNGKSPSFKPFFIVRRQPRLAGIVRRRRSLWDRNCPSQGINQGSVLA
jgi:hypothetical protein